MIVLVCGKCSYRLERRTEGDINESDRVSVCPECGDSYHLSNNKYHGVSRSLRMRNYGIETYRELQGKDNSHEIE